MGKPDKFASSSAILIICGDINPNIVKAGASKESIEGIGPCIPLVQSFCRQSWS